MVKWIPVGRSLRFFRFSCADSSVLKRTVLFVGWKEVQNRKGVTCECTNWKWNGKGKRESIAVLWRCEGVWDPYSRGSSCEGKWPCRHFIGSRHNRSVLNEVRRYSSLKKVFLFKSVRKSAGRNERRKGRDRVGGMSKAGRESRIVK